PSAQKTAATQIGTDIGALTVEALGQQLRDVLPTRRLHSVSLCDHQANVLWLSEGALGPDEHALVVEALELLSTDTSLPCHELALDDGRLAMFLPVRTPTADLVGIAMILADGKALGDETLERMAAAPVRAIMLRLAVLLKPAALRTAAAAATTLELVDETQAAAAAAAVKPMSPVEVNDILEFDLPPKEMPAPRARTGASASEMMSLEFIDIPVIDERFLEAAPAPTPAPPAAAASAGEAVELADSATTTEAPGPLAAPAKPVPKAAPPAARRTAAPAAAPAARPEEKAPAPSVAAPAATVMSPAAANDPNLLLEVLPFAKLRAGGQTRRFQVIARMSAGPRDPAAFDALILQRLMAWLAAHRAAWNSQPTSFTVNLSISTLEDERFAQKLAAALNSHAIAADTLGFEITEALCTQRRAQVERFITQCEKIGAWVLIDDFSFDAQVLPLLRSKAVRVVKLSARLTSSALKDKLSQAMVVATVQAAKVLGIHCAAKKVDSQAALQWLTAIGCDFAQGAALAGAQSLESLAGSPDPTGLTALLRPS
ncbi:MAG TPA: EAL domain-containing protein, partial [Steroidobacteraceae bacterium]|nr:EAL domain-containing protein [Steroidobacteraceae bacterium]